MILRAGLGLIAALLLAGCMTTGQGLGGTTTADGVTTPPEGLILQYAVTSFTNGEQRRGALQVVGIRDDTVSLRQMVGPQVTERLDFYRGLVPLGVSSAEADLPPLTTGDHASDRHFSLALDPKQLEALWPLDQGKQVRVSDVPSALPVRFSASASETLATRPATLDIRVGGATTVDIQDRPIEVVVVDIDRTPAEGDISRLKVWYSRDLGVALQTALARVVDGEEELQEVLTVQRLILPIVAQ